MPSARSPRRPGFLWGLLLPEYRSDRGADLGAGTGSRCAILDLDFHHGNGIQQIFWEREEVFFASLHATPSEAYPFFSGYPDEQGSGEGFGATRNIPLPLQTQWPSYHEALVELMESVTNFQPEALIVSLGTDTYLGDPVGGLGLEVEDFEVMGQQIASIGLPVVTVMEGGYHLPTVGACVAGFFRGLQAA